MSSATTFPQRPTLPPLRSLDLPMHGVPSRMTLPGIHELCSQGDSDLVRLLYFRVNAVAVDTDTVDSITGPVTSHRTLCLAMETSRINIFTNHLMLPVHSASLISYIYATQLSASPDTT